MHNSMTKCEVLIIGGGAIGLSIGIAIQESRSHARVVIIEKEEEICLHASGRNSGVIHAGFYYSSESLKSKFCRLGNLELKKFCHDKDLQIRECGKVVVAKNAGDVKLLENLAERAQVNGVDVELLDAEDLATYEPMARTHEKFLWSPTTAIADPHEVAQALKRRFLAGGGQLLCGEHLVEFRGDLAIFSSGNSVSFNVCVNSAGAGALSIAKKCGVGKEFGLLPVLGGYISTSASKIPLKRMVYAAPHPLSPFLGIHFTPTLNGMVKIGPTAMPVFGREQYSISDGFTSEEARQSLRALSNYVFGDPINAIKTLANQISQANLQRMVLAASELIPTTPNSKAWRRGKAGIRSQLVDFNKKVFVQDFIVSESPGVIHILNAVSPGWTSALPFGRYIVEEFIMGKF